MIDELWDDVLLGEHRARPGIGHRLPPSVLTTGEEATGPVPPPTVPDAPADAGGSTAPADPAMPDAGGASAGSTGTGGAGAAPGGGRGEEQAPEMVLRETEAALAAFVAESAAPDEVAALGAAPGPQEVRRLVEAASRVVVRKLAGARTVRAAGSRMAAVRYNFRSDDLDLDRTVEELVANPIPSWSDIWVRDRVPRRRGVVLILDVSGSMRGEPLLHAATAAGAATLALTGSDDLTVVAFWRSSAVLLAPGEPSGALPVVSRVLALRPWGLTDIAGGLTRAAQLLDRMPTPQRQALVMTDGRANAGPDPVGVAARFARLDVLATDGSPATLQRCRALASAGHGTCRSYDGLDELPLRLSELLSG
ncbi:vWA domain-containing protein [Pseudonocardia nigra]|uniref:vWA domain-containing protein n=1 Tax=Pseudonocardia nigra TaxID=1921578 RepID=UPI001C5E350F|nr:vWA domain-containing protein [Pseudonocardia nigra]